MSRRVSAIAMPQHSRARGGGNQSRRPSAADECGVKVTGEFGDMVRWVSSVSLAPHGRVRPSADGHTWSSAPNQPAKASVWCPPGFEVTRAIKDDKWALFYAARELRHPLSSVEVRLVEDLDCAVQAVCRMRERIEFAYMYGIY